MKRVAALSHLSHFSACRKITAEYILAHTLSCKTKENTHKLITEKKIKLWLVKSENSDVAQGLCAQLFNSKQS